MSLSDSAETSMAMTLAAILIAVATFCLTIMSIQTDAKLSVSNEIFGFLGLGALLASALSIDSVLDKAGCGFNYRLTKLMNGGYSLFCIVISGMSFAILFLYHSQESTCGTLWCFSFICYFFSSVFLFLKLMLDDKDHLFGPLLVITYIISVLVTNNH